jgi:hypothetical protein
LNFKTVRPKKNRTHQKGYILYKRVAMELAAFNISAEQ